MVSPYVVEFLDLPVPPNARGDTYRLALHIYPDPGPDAPVVVIFPAMGTPARFYRPFAQRLGAGGVAVVVADLRGTGDSTPGPSRADRYRYADLADDVGSVLDALKPRLDGRRYFVLGHSLGGQVSALRLARVAMDGDRPEPTGLILVAVGLPYYRLYRRGRRLAVLAFAQLMAAVTALCRVWPGWALGGRQSRGVMLDWAYTVRHGRYRPIDGAPVRFDLVRTPVLAISVANDWFTPHETLDHLCALLSSAPITRVRLEGPLDPTNPRNEDAHFAWARTPEAVAARVLAYIRP